MDDQPLLPVAGDDAKGAFAGVQTFKAYPRRWWILFLLSVTSMHQSNVWATFSPIVTPVREVYGWHSGTVDILAAWGPLIYLPTSFVCPSIVDRIGLRASITLAISLVCAGTVLRSLTTVAPYAIILAHAGQILNACSGPLVLATPSKLASEWFPPQQRTLAVSIAVMANYFGTGVGFLVAMPVKHAQGIHILLWGEAIFAGIIVVLCIIDHAFFPPLPPSVPSATASKHRAVDTIKDFGQLLSNGNFMVLCLTYGVSLGTYSGWSGVLGPILEPLGYSQSTASWVGFASTLGCVVGGIVCGRLGDIMSRFKGILLFLFLLSTLTFVWFSLITNKTIKPSEWQLYLSVTFGSLVLNAGSGLFYEAAVEVSYPIGEVGTSAVMTFIFNAASAIYLIITSKIPAQTMNWLLTACCGACGVGLLFFKVCRACIGYSNVGMSSWQGCCV